MNAIEANLNARIPTARLASFYFAYYAALGAFNPYWALYLEVSARMSPRSAS